MLELLQRGVIDPNIQMHEEIRNSKDTHSSHCSSDIDYAISTERCHK